MARDQYVMRKLAQGYAGPSARPGCHGCAHAIKPPGFGTSMSCRKGGFLVHPFGICNHYTPRGRSASRPSEKHHEEL